MQFHLEVFLFVFGGFAFLKSNCSQNHERIHIDLIASDNIQYILPRL